MAFTDFFKGKKRPRVGVRQSYQVTMLGKEKDEKQVLDGAYGKVLNYLVQDGPSSYAEIERETGLSEEKVKMVLNGLMGNGYVAKVTGE